MKRQADRLGGEAAVVRGGQGELFGDRMGREAGRLLGPALDARLLQGAAQTLGHLGRHLGMIFERADVGQGLLLVVLGRVVFVEVGIEPCIGGLFVGG